MKHPDLALIRSDISGSLIATVSSFTTSFWHCAMWTVFDPINPFVVWGKFHQKYYHPVFFLNKWTVWSSKLMGTTSNDIHQWKAELICFCFEMFICSHFWTGTILSSLHGNTVYTVMIYLHVCLPYRTTSFLRVYTWNNAHLPQRKHYKVTKGLKQCPKMFEYLDLLQRQALELIINILASKVNSSSSSANNLYFS